MDIKVSVAGWNGENSPCGIIRQTVFVEEQGFKNEFDHIDINAFHAIAFVDGIACATGRLYGKDTTAHIGRIAVLKEYRNHQLGSVIVKALEDKAKAVGYTECELSAQTRVKDFYINLGYTCIGEEYLNEFCPHILMHKAL